MSKKNLMLSTILGIMLIGLVGASYLNFAQKKTQSQPLTKVSENKNTAVDETKNIPFLSTVADNLEIPWALVFLPDKSILFTERAGRVRLIDKNGNLLSNPIAIIPDVKNIGEGGLLGITIHPDFIKNYFVYLCYTYANDNGQTLNRVVRFKFENNSLSNKTIIVDETPGNVFHDGGRIKFGPDGFLYITTGDSQNPSLAQDKNSLAGKILRVTDVGQPAPDNPFNNLVYSYGHRNPQGLAWDSMNRLWATEHGPSGGQFGTGNDELNLIKQGQNYGWPVIQGNQKQDGMETPIINSASDIWAPSGAAFFNGSIFFAGLRGEALYEAEIKGNNAVLKEHLKGKIGRIREVVVGPDNFLYLTTSNRDGRGIPDEFDDKIIRVNPSRL